MLIPFGVFSAAGAGGGAAAGAYELISTTTLGADTAAVTFSSIVGTYKHLQIRSTQKANATARAAQLTFNGVSTASYSNHQLAGDGSTVSSTGNTSTTYILLQNYSSATTTANAFGAGVIDILDYTSTNKNKTIKALFGQADAATLIYLASGQFMNTSAITSLTLTAATFFTTGSRFSLYGIRG